MQFVCEVGPGTRVNGDFGPSQGPDSPLSTRPTLRGAAAGRGPTVHFTPSQPNPFPRGTSAPSDLGLLGADGRRDLGVGGRGVRLAEDRRAGDEPVGAGAGSVGPRAGVDAAVDLDDGGGREIAERLELGE